MGGKFSAHLITKRAITCLVQQKGYLKMLQLFVLIVSFSSVTGVEHICPKFKEGMNIIACKINTTLVENEGCYMAKNVTFDWRRALALDILDISLCIAPPPSPSFCKKQEDASPNTCWCDESDREMFTYKFSYMLDSDKGGYLDCKYCISPKNSNMDEGCKIENIEKSDSMMIGGKPALILAVLLLGCWGMKYVASNT